MSEVPEIQFIGRVLRAVAQQRKAVTVQTVQNTAKIPQVLLQFLEVVDVPVVVQRQAGVDVAITVVGGVEGVLDALSALFALRPWTGVPIFQPSSAHSCECSRAPRVPESPRVLLPGELGTRLHNSCSVTVTIHLMLNARV